MDSSKGPHTNPSPNSSSQIHPGDSANPTPQRHANKRRSSSQLLTAQTILIPPTLGDGPPNHGSRPQLEHTRDLKSEIQIMMEHQMQTTWAQINEDIKENMVARLRHEEEFSRKLKGENNELKRRLKDEPFKKNEELLEKNVMLVRQNEEILEIHRELMSRGLLSNTQNLLKLVRDTVWKR